MKMKKLARVFTSAVLVSAMVATMGGMTAFAAVDSVPLTKNLETDPNVLAPAASFEFVISEGREGSLDAGKFGNTDQNSSNKTLKVKAGIEDGLYFSRDGASIKKTATISSLVKSDSKSTDSKWVYSNNDTQIYINEDKFTTATTPGIYHYVVHEKTPTKDSITQYPGITYDEKDYDVYVYVFVNEETDESYVDDIIVAGPDGTKVGDGNGDGITYDKGVVITNTYATKNLTVTKTVSGNQGEKGRAFNFSISVKPGNTEVSGEESYNLVYGNTSVTLNKDNNWTVSNVTLAHNAIATIYGLTADDKYTVKEDNYAGEGYETTMTIAETGKEDETLTFINNQDRTTGEKSMEDSTAITVTNRKNVTTPTGIVLSFAPYILLVALAGVFGVLFLRRRKEEF